MQVGVAGFADPELQRLLRRVDDRAVGAVDLDGVLSAMSLAAAGGELGAFQDAGGEGAGAALRCPGVAGA